MAGLSEIEFTVPVVYSRITSHTGFQIRVEVICGLWCKAIHGFPFVNDRNVKEAVGLRTPFFAFLFACLERPAGVQQLAGSGIFTLRPFGTSGSADSAR
jgi:hypothetical protein